MVNLHTLFSFFGRIRRLQWWIGSLLAVGLAFVCVFVSAMIVTGIYGSTLRIPPTASMILATLVLVIYVMLIWIQLALGVKRLHDRDNSGWWMLLGFVPLANFALFIMIGFLDGTQGPNKYGPSPKGIGGDVGDRELNSVFS